MDRWERERKKWRKIGIEGLGEGGKEGVRKRTRDLSIVDSVGLWCSGEPDMLPNYLLPGTILAHLAITRTQQVSQYHCEIRNKHHTLSSVFYILGQVQIFPWTLSIQNYSSNILITKYCLIRHMNGPHQIVFWEEGEPIISRAKEKWELLDKWYKKTECTILPLPGNNRSSS